MSPLDPLLGGADDPSACETLEAPLDESAGGFTVKNSAEFPTTGALGTSATGSEGVGDSVDSESTTGAGDSTGSLSTTGG